MKTTIHIDETTTINRVVKDGLVNYKNEKFLAYEQHGKYKIDLERPVKSDLDKIPEDVILKRAEEILTLRHKREPNLFLESPDAIKSGLERESFELVTMDNRHRLISIETLFLGDIDSASVYPRIVAQKCLKINAAAAAVAHNHPSGVASPSRADVEITKRLKEALSLINVRLLDHFVVTDREVISLAERGEV